MGKIVIWCVDWWQKLTNQNEKIIFPRLTPKVRLRLSKFNIYNVLIPIHHDLSLLYVPHLLGFHLILLISQEYTCNWKDKWNINEYNHTFWCDDFMFFLAKKMVLDLFGTQAIASYWQVLWQMTFFFNY